MARDREETKAKILQAVGKVLGTSGFQGLGVNAIAREAGVDKVLIYRYFKDVPTLLKTFAQSGDYVGSLDRLLTQASPEQLADWRSALVLLVMGYAKTLQHNPLSQEIFRWELTEKNELTESLALTREKMIQAGLDWMRQQYPEVADYDLEAITAILLSSVTYLVLRSRTRQTFLDIDFSQSTGLIQVETTIRKFLESIE
ncbi:TetR/AcrR family transcriptional regulator [filamentous cyanobacterium LEGE 11480]|uniref:TetR/AcrR family transcriptional regulator n=1 Tax=Romeriopsis navalis LEGE 11480 TaxID=2777977 RepID=A0A928VND2_9CYAN|nr:TetR/AcrR family transcriptional regulator [Romeriopsis navalis]MBE9029680.1 TetR/AcrR family transcriptional regulator [Romeriopsis navalis LEGE 11480]